MHSLLFAVALAALPADLPIAPEAQAVAVVKLDRNTWLATGASLLSVGWAASVTNTSVAWASCTAHLSCNSYTGYVWPFGLAVSTLPLIGPAAGIIFDLAMGVGSRDETAFWVRTAVNFASLAMQVTGVVMLITLPRVPKAERSQRVAITGFGAAPSREGASVGLSGSF